MDVAKLIAALTAYGDIASGQPRVAVAETLHRRYWIVGVRPDRDGDPILELVFADQQED